jgi:hypothetical protein
MPISVVLAATLITVSPPKGRSEAECVKLFPRDWGKIADCMMPPIDISKNPKLREFFAACEAARKAAETKTVKVKAITLVVHGIEQECTLSGGQSK